MEQFLINSYQDTHDATITSFYDNGMAVTLDSSIIYPGGGGQPGDKAWLEVNSEQTLAVMTMAMQFIISTKHCLLTHSM
ncbi:MULTISPECIES: hypothetical protein [Holzapfeliella]|uniref:Alanyl-tRNA synthetase class IIc N-terminal domain-containing protein n=1 Tax=Holzapfeliella floricola DSM 23037 = JCM 16512 TaxID=1423744 RepID=A0A0R2DPM9_9LACO|nr:hypothetical protein [Holzapfeliella floricola]KRN03749.1 hypothetical protein FC86_GL000860 [Holzapfeliella floricola DSM 23037 = JCM 16512]